MTNQPSPPSHSRPEQSNRQVELSREQRDAVEALIDGVEFGRRLQTLGGYAGTGKTTIIAELIERLRDGRSVGVMTPTGRAACVLRRKGVRGAETIHAHIYQPIPECGRPGTIPKCGQPRCRCRIVGWKRNESLPFSVAIIDEASMVTKSAYHDLAAFGVRIIAVGDHGQLPPIQEPGTAPFSLMSDPDIRLETIHRHAGDIPRFAEHLRNGEPAFRFRPRDGSVQIVGKDQPLDRLPVMKADRIICAKNRTRVAINAFYRRTKGLDGKVVEGEVVMCLKNDRDSGLYNGTLATVTEIYGDGKFDLDSEEGTKRRIAFDPDQFGRTRPRELRFGDHLLPFDFGYASTCHKAQGGEWPYVLVIEEFLGNRVWEHSRWAYTAASRAQGRIVWRASTQIYYPTYDYDREIGGGR